MVVCANALLSVLSDEHRIKKVDTAFLFYDFIIVDNYKWNYLGFFGELFRPTPSASQCMNKSAYKKLNIQKVICYCVTSWMS